jgi:hypothetical protein
VSGGPGQIAPRKCTTPNGWLTGQSHAAPLHSPRRDWAFHVVVKYASFYRHSDDLGVWPRIIRRNSFPLFVLVVLLGGLLALRFAGGAYALALFQAILRRISDIELKVASTRKWTSPFTAEFGRIVNINALIPSGGQVPSLSAIRKIVGDGDEAVEGVHEALARKESKGELCRRCWAGETGPGQRVCLFSQTWLLPLRGTETRSVDKR